MNFYRHTQFKQKRHLLFTLMFVFLLIVLGSCNSYSHYFNKIYKCNKEIQEGDYVDASKTFQDFENGNNAKIITEHKIAYNYVKARLLLQEGKITKAKELADNLLEEYNLLNSTKRSKLSRQNINQPEIEKLINDILAILPPQIPEPYSYISSSERLNATRIADSLNEIEHYKEVEKNFEKKVQKTGKFPTISNFDIERNGGDIKLTYEYGDKNNVNVNIAAFPPGKYITETTQNALYVFKSILETFVETEKNINYNDVTITLTGMADGIPVSGDLLYTGEFGSIENQLAYSINSKSYFRLNRLSDGDRIRNQELAFLRAYHPKYEILKINSFSTSKVNIITEELSTKGPAYRKVIIEIYMKNAHKLLLDRLDPFTANYIYNTDSKKGLPKIPVEKISYYQGKKIAIIIGVADYQNLEPSLSGDKASQGTSLHDLEYADNDAIDFASLLENEIYSGGGWDIKKLINSQAKIVDIKKVINQTLQQSNEDDLIYIFFSGHGISDPDDYNKIYLLPYDYRQDYVSGSSYSYTELLDAVSSAKAKHIILFIDACRSGSIAISSSGSKGENIPAPNLEPDVLKSKINSLPETKIIFSSSKGRQISYEEGGEIQNGLYTYFLIKGLYGSAPNLIGNNFVDLFEIYKYVRDKVKSHTKDKLYGPQIPDFIGFKGSETQAFPITNRLPK